METKPVEKQCPVCGMKVTSDDFRLSLDEGLYVFCSPHCREKFMQDNDLYAVPGADNTAPR